jgi:hypothetical protein
MKRWLHVHKWPLWLFELFGSGKSFVANPFIGSRLLNRLGLHVVRLTLAHAVMQFRWFLLRPLLRKDLRDRFQRDGFLVLPDFLPARDFERLRADVAHVGGIAREMTQGDTYTQRILLDDDALTGAAEVRAFVDSRRYRNLLSYVAGKNHPALVYLHRIRNGFRRGGVDPQKSIHSDTFQPHMKAWYYLDDVPMGKGPFNFVPGSHHLTWARLKWEYRKSITTLDHRDGYSEKGSLRVLPEDLKEMGLPAPQALAVKANTLVIGTPNGFHGRGDATPGETRFEIWAYNRRHPFNLLPGFGLGFLGKLECAAMQTWWRRLDRKAAKRGAQATWHLIDRQAVIRADYQTPEGQITSPSRNKKAPATR